MFGNHFCVRVIKSTPQPPLTDDRYPRYQEEPILEVNMETLDINALMMFLCTYKVAGDNLKPAPGTWVAVPA